MKQVIIFNWDSDILVGFCCSQKPSLISEILTNILVLCIFREYYITSQLFYCLFSFNVIINIENLSGAEEYFPLQENKER